MKRNLFLILAISMMAISYLHAQTDPEQKKDPPAHKPSSFQITPPQVMGRTTEQMLLDKASSKSPLTPFTGHVDVDLDAFKPGLSIQNIDSTTATYTIYYDDIGNYFSTGISGSSSILADVPGPSMAFLSLSTDFGITANYQQIVHLNHLTGSMGIGTGSPAVNTRLHVRQPDDNSSTNGIIFSEFAGPTGSFNDLPAVLGKNTVDDYYGIGIKGQGGYMGVRGEVAATGNQQYFGLYGYVTGGTGINYGVYGVSSGGNRSYAIYGSGNMKTTGKLFVGTSTAVEDSAPNYRLLVDGQGIMEELRIKNSNNWPDYVFQSQYNLLSIEEMESYILQNGHLPGVPSAGEIAQQGGTDVGNMQKILLEKVEELSLYIIELKKENEELRQLIQGKRRHKKNTGK